VVLKSHWQGRKGMRRLQRGGGGGKRGLRMRVTRENAGCRGDVRGIEWGVKKGKAKGGKRG